MNRENIDLEVENIIKMFGFKFNKDVEEHLNNRKVPSDTIKKIGDIISEKRHKMMNQAKKIAHKIYEKYGQVDTTSLNEYLKDNKKSYILKYDLKSKMGFKDFKKNIFNTINQSLDMLDLSGKKNKLDKKYSKDDLKDLHKLYRTNFNLYKQVQTQSLLYEENNVSRNDLSYKNNSNINVNSFDGIHPVIFALYNNKYHAFEKYTLNSNLARALVNKYENNNVKNDYDHLLLESIMQDPNNTVCSSSSELVDYYRRCKVQISLWKNVLSLRNYNFYAENLTNELFESIDRCSATDIDTPNFLYFGEEEKLIKKILSSISYRPIFTINQKINIIMKPLGNKNIKDYSSMQMLSFRPKKDGTNNLASLYDKNNSNITYSYNNNTLIPSYYNIEDVREMLIIHVVRSQQRIKPSNNIFEPLLITTPPNNVNSNIEYIDDPVEFEPTISNLTDNNRTFTLKSVICQFKQENNKLLSGNISNFCLFKDGDEHKCYNPYFCNIDGNVVNRNVPIYKITVDKFNELARKNGSIFMYQDDDYKNNLQ